jgi:hypothetical protein
MKVGFSTFCVESSNNILLVNMFYSIFLLYMSRVTLEVRYNLILMLSIPMKVTGSHMYCIVQCKSLLSTFTKSPLSERCITVFVFFLLFVFLFVICKRKLQLKQHPKDSLRFSDQYEHQTDHKTCSLV